jgi:hypothetical protein
VQGLSAPNLSALGLDPKGIVVSVEGSGHMRPEILKSEFVKILEASFVPKEVENVEDSVLALNEEQMFLLWNMLGEELGIDLSLASADQRRLLFDACEGGKKLLPRDFSSLLWLVYYGDAYTH